ncbi:MAG: ATP-binding protein [Nitrososphaerota archaeon]|jgi:predicted AAA+ superfamily ATPase|nr:ATP-binding protein [Nitrososphaerota archaeon]MDG6929625.1 ATP-binding protein [Nitrososphaerota archaeon]MDG6932394.1 ATP-binding protein [Nitrososphaerota archaeon]MDG6935737.1 ATP-binding protein [Nitrososphaerota archaeon]MDG6944723.1 ATP-binding protein [Nitrososphaerota archaeon]
MDIKQYIVDKKSDIDGLDVKSRGINLEPTINFVTVITGPRRAGKSYTLFEFIKEKGIAREDYVFINFEDEGILDLKREDIIRLPYISKEIYGREPLYLFFDEVQNIDKWERLVYTLYERKKYRVVVTGSSSKLFSREIATELRGRALPVEILPFSFAEACKIRNINISSVPSSSEISGIKHELLDYMSRGGFPDVLLGNVKPELFFRQYLDLVVFKDITERFGIRNISIMKMLMSSIMSSFGKEFSVRKQFESIKSLGIKVSMKTLYSYSQLFEDAFFCFFIPKFSFSPRKRSLSVKKVYPNDTGFLSMANDTGSRMESVVFLELLRRKENYNISYWKDYQGHEVDFVIDTKSKPVMLVQVTYAEKREDVKPREILSIIHAAKDLSCNNLLIITWDLESEEMIEGMKIKFAPLWKWLLAGKSLS